MGGCLNVYSHVYNFSLLPPSLLEMARHGLKYSPFNPISSNIRIIKGKAMCNKPHLLLERFVSCVVYSTIHVQGLLNTTDDCIGSLQMTH